MPYMLFQFQTFTVFILVTLSLHQQIMSSVVFSSCLHRVPGTGADRFQLSWVKGI